MKSLLVSLIVLISLVGCGGTSSSPSADPAPTVSSSNDALPNQDTRETLYLQMVHDRIPQTDVIADDKLVQLGQDNCDSFDSMHLHSKAQFYQYSIGFQKGVKDIMTLSDTAYYLGTTIAAFCPQYSYILN